MAKAKFTNEIITQIVALQERGVPLSEIAYKFDISYGMVAQVLHKYKSEGTKMTLTDWIEHRERMLWLLNRGVTLDEVSKMYRAAPGQIAAITGLKRAA